MSLNPVQFGKDVIDQFGRYLMTTFPVADERLAAQVRARLRHTVGSDSLLYKGPYVYLNQPFEPGPPLTDLTRAGTLHRALEGIFPYDSLHKHQSDALQAVQAGQHIILSTGTGSGKTESFMLPIVDYCLHLRDSNTAEGVVAILVYPMNALVNDQLERLRLLLAGTRITFGRYTGETPDARDENLHHQPAPVNYTNQQRLLYKEGKAAFGSLELPFPWEEAHDKASIRARRPRILLTNYAQLEYMLLRDKDLQLLRGAPLQFMVLDEVHTYTGALGSEVACLIRRIRDVVGKSPEEVIMIGTSATVSDKPKKDEPQIDAETATRRFAKRLLGVPDVTVIRESYRQIKASETYLPLLPDGILSILDDILHVARDVQLQAEVDAGDIPAALVELASELCDLSVPNVSSRMEQLALLLSENACIVKLSQIFTEPRTWEAALNTWRSLGGGRYEASDEMLIAEMLAYLTLGALTIVDGDPLLRPKLHYFVQGLQGLGIVFSAERDPQITFDDTEGVMPLLLCRSCGQHYSRLIAGEWQKSNDSDYGYREARVPSRFEEPNENAGTGWLYLTDRFHTETDEDEDDRKNWGDVYLCTQCFTIHEKHEPHCLNPRCQAHRELVKLSAWQDKDEDIPKRCGACGGPNSSKTPLISYTRSAGVADVTILAQSMLTMMREETLRKVLIFADSRQDAAFQAGWMQRRSKRFRLRHLIYQIIQEDSHPWNWDTLTNEIIARAQSMGILPRKDFQNKEQQTEIRWFLIEEFALPTQRRSNLEQLGLVGITYGELDSPDDPFFQTWASQLGTTPEGILSVVWTLLDTFRRRGLLSDPLLARYWSERFDREVQEGLVSITDYYRPTALVLERYAPNSHLKGWLASNGRSQAQVIFDTAFERKKPLRDAFLKALWQWLIKQQYLVPVELIQRRQGHFVAISNLPDAVYHVNLERLGLWQTQEYYQCVHCHRTQQKRTPSGGCPEYRCKGKLQAAELDTEHFDVVQYTQLEFVPLVAREHSAQVPQKRRLEAEKEFKSERGSINTIVATPTLEMGVDIGKLEMVVMRNVPPTPANYAQRAGRAGRRHRIAAIFTYAGGSQHDRYFFNDPPEMIAGAVRVPAFSMRNEPLIRKHVHSAALTVLRAMVNNTEQNILNAAFPTYIGSYLATWQSDQDRKRQRFYEESPSFQDFSQLVSRYRSEILKRLTGIFEQYWPDEDKEAVSQAHLANYLDEMAIELDKHVRMLFAQFRVYRQALARFAEIEQRSEGLNAEEKQQRRRFEQARERYLKEEIANYTLSWLAVDGFFPGYALSRESVQATSLQPLMDLSRPSTVALRELTPANWVYADGNVFAVQRLNFSKLKASDERFTPDSLREKMVYDAAQGRLYDTYQAMTEGSVQGREVISYRLTDVEMEKNQDIDDRRDGRRRIAFEMAGMLLDEHSGGVYGQVGAKEYKYLFQETVRLANLGQMRLGPTGIQGFPLCPACGETRTPQATQEEIDRFREDHRGRCEVNDILFAGLHIDLLSDVLMFGPYVEPAEAINAYEGLLVGASLVLDMNNGDLEGFLYTDSDGQIWATLYDTLPGGTGFLQQMMEYWDAICFKGAQALQSCSCEKACYRCLQHFRNQQHHTLLDRRLGMFLLEDLSGQPQKLHDIPPVVKPTWESQPPKDTMDSPAEAKFLQILQERGFPMPEGQLRVDLGNGNYTTADFAWPDKRILVFIDGTSPQLHGNSEQAKKDRSKRLQATILGWLVNEITAQGLNDEQSLGRLLEDIAYYLEH